MTKEEPLEDRIIAVGQATESLRKAVSGPYVDPNKLKGIVDSLKNEGLAKAISGEIERFKLPHTRRKKNFEDTLASDNFDVRGLIPVYYGIQSAIPHLDLNMKKILSKMTNYEKMYFFAGVWLKRGTPFQGEDLTESIYGYIAAGIYLIQRFAGSKKPLPEESRIKEDSLEYQARLRRRPSGDEWYNR